MEAIRGIGELIPGDEQRLSDLFASAKHPVCLDVFEPAGRMPIAQGLMKVSIINKLVDQGCTVKILIDDWLSEQKGRLGGDVKKFRATGEHMIEVWKSIGLNVDSVEFIWSSEVLLSASTLEYWPIMLDVTRHCDLSRIFKCLGTTGGDAGNLTSEQQDLASSDLIFPCFQCASICFIKPDICLLGLDKKNVAELLESYSDDIQRPKPVMLPNVILPGLKEGQKEMSRTPADSCIFMEDEESDVKTKIKKAFCPPNIAVGNPCIDLVKHVILPRCNEFPVTRVPEYGGNKTYTSAEDLCSDYTSGALHPGDLKASITSSLNKILRPVREHLKNNPKARELFNKVKKYKMT